MTRVLRERVTPTTDAATKGTVMTGYAAMYPHGLAAVIRGVG